MSDSNTSNRKTVDNDYNDPIFVVDCETTGLTGYPRNYVVEIGVSKVNIDQNLVEKFYNEIIGYDLNQWSHSNYSAWIFKSYPNGDCDAHPDLNKNCYGGDDGSDITHKDVLEAYDNGRTIDVVTTELHEKIQNEINGNPAKITAYNNGFDFDKFLLRDERWRMYDSEYYKILDCLMLASTPVCQLHNPYGYGYKWPTLQEARYKMFDPMYIRKNKVPGESHRADDDAYIAGHILLELYENHNYSLK